MESDKSDNLLDEVASDPDDDTARPTEPTDKERELLEDARQTKQELEAQQNEFLEAVRSGEDFQIEDYEWVKLGGLELKVKTWFPGDTVNKVTQVAEANGSQQDDLETTLEAFTELTEQVGREDAFTEETKIRGFWDRYYAEWGVNGIEEAIETVAGPASRDDEDRVVESFHGDRQR